MTIIHSAPTRSSHHLLVMASWITIMTAAAGAFFGWWAKGRGLWTEALGLIHLEQPSAPRNPFVSSSRPAAGEDNVPPDAYLTAQLWLPNGGIDGSTLTPATVLLRCGGVMVDTTLTVSTGGASIVIRPTTPMQANSEYVLEITSGVKDTAGCAATPYTCSFTTGANGGPADPAIRFEQVALPPTKGFGYTAVRVGPDDRLYAATDDGRIFRYAIDSDGTLRSPEVIRSLQSAEGGRRLVSGFCFDPSSPPDAPILWVAHNFYAFENAPDFTGKISRLSGPLLETVRDVIIHLPRSSRDHLTNQPSFGPDGALYFPQGCNSTYGAPDATWGNRPEHLLSGTILRLDVAKLPPGGFIDALTPDAGGHYDPAATGAPLTIYASGLRNAFDLVWHSSGHLYAPNNGSSPGGNTPAGNGATALHGLALSEDDWLYRVEPGKYYGHPNPEQGHYVLNGGNPASATGSARVRQYPLGTNPDSMWTPGAFNFGKHVSPNGIIEYRGAAFGGRLDHKLLVCRYNIGADLIALDLDAAGNVTSVQTNIPGLSGLANPLDVTEDERTGYLYVSEYGRQRLTLLRPVTNRAKNTQRRG